MLSLNNLAKPVTAVALALLGAVDAAPSPSIPEVRSSSSTPQIGHINVTVATLWTNPSKPRELDAPALASPARIQEWLDSMTDEQFRDLTDNSRTQSQALYGSMVHITDSQDGWYKVAVPGFPSPSSEIGYPGWVPSRQVATEDYVYGVLQEVRPFAKVRKGPTVSLYHDIFLKNKIMDISYDTRLPLVVKLGRSIQVAVPGGLAYLSEDDADVFNSADDIPYPTGADLIEAGKMFVGRPYLWGGASGFAFDCSGFTHTMYDGHGITIPRDSGPQAYMEGYGTLVEQADLAAGDLIFYSHNTSDAHSIYHVAMYAGDGQMLEAYAAGTPTRLTEARFNEDYWGARRFLKQ